MVGGGGKSHLQNMGGGDAANELMNVVGADITRVRGCSRAVRRTLERREDSQVRAV